MPDWEPWVVALGGLGVLGAAFLAFRIARWAVGWARWWGATSGSRILGVAWMAAIVAGVALSRSSAVGLKLEGSRMRPGLEAETSYVPPAGVLRMVSLGHQGFVADLLFVRANQYFVRHLFADRSFAWLETFVDGILALDPMNPRVYEWASQAVKYGQKLDNQMIARSNRYAEKGIERFPDLWRFYFDVGFNLYFEWQTGSQADRDEVRQRALPYFSVAAALPGSKLDPNFLAELYRVQDDVEMALFQAYLHYWEAGEEERKTLMARIQTLGQSAQAQRFARVEETWKRDFPYLPIGLYELAGGDP
jgi:hypothetical protein